MIHHRFRRGCLAVASLAALSALPGEGHAQTACRAGPLSAFLQSSGMGCAIGKSRLLQFSSQGLNTQAGNVWLDPFTLQGPPGYTWVGFHVRFSPGAQFVSNTPLGLSFFADGVPLYGVMGYNSMASGAGMPMESRTRVTLTGDGGVRQVVDRTELMRQGNTMRVLRGCGWTTGGTRSCVAGDSTALTGLLADADQRYAIAAQSMILGAGMNGQPGDFTVAILTDQAIATPEPASLFLLSTGVAGVGMMVRRRRRGAVS